MFWVSDEFYRKFQLAYGIELHQTQYIVQQTQPRWTRQTAWNLPLRKKKDYPLVSFIAFAFHLKLLELKHMQYSSKVYVACQILNVTL